MKPVPRLEMTSKLRRNLAWRYWPIPLRLVLLQLALGGLCALTWGWLDGRSAAYAALSGAGIAVIGSSFFAARIFLRGRGTPERMLRGFMTAEVLKIALTVGMFVFAMTLFADRFLPVVASYGIASLAFLWALRWGADASTTKQGFTDSDGSRRPDSDV